MIFLVLITKHTGILKNKELTYKRINMFNLIVLTIIVFYDKILHSKLYKCAENSLVDCEASSLWLKKGNIKARDEATLCFLQDRNLFYGNKSSCPHCISTKKMVN
ncbi:hypothetical protein NUSPORA_02784 [Nucleospora cyclopteri]